MLGVLYSTKGKNLAQKNQNCHGNIEYNLIVFIREKMLFFLLE